MLTSRRIRPPPRMGTLTPRVLLCERAAIIYQHAARGADAAITEAMQVHVQAERADDEDRGDGTGGTLVRQLIARGLAEGNCQAGRAATNRTVTCSFCFERVTRIELALSAWEPDRFRPPTALTWAPDVPPGTVIDP